MKKTIGEFKDLHKGEPCCILANGPSMLDLKDRIPDDMMTIGMNASWSHIESPYWVGLDLSTLWKARSEMYNPEYTFLPDTPGFDYGRKIEIPTTYGRRFSWSRDLTKVIYPCRATIWYTFQLAAFMGFDPVFVVGFDLDGPRPSGHVNAGQPMEPAGIYHQLQLMGYLRRLLEERAVTTRFYNCSTESKCEVLPFHVPTRKDDWNPPGYPLHAEDEGRFEDLFPGVTSGKAPHQEMVRLQ